MRFCARTGSIMLFGCDISVGTFVNSIFKFYHPVTFTKHRVNRKGDNISVIRMIYKISNRVRIYLLDEIRIKYIEIYFIIIISINIMCCRLWIRIYSDLQFLAHSYIQ